MALVVRNGRLDGELVDVFIDDGTFTAVTPAGAVRIRAIASSARSTWAGRC